MIDFEGTEDEAYALIVALVKEKGASYVHQIVVHDFRNMMNSVIGGVQVLEILNEDCTSNADNISKTVELMDARSRQILIVVSAYFRYQHEHQISEQDDVDK